jgi:exodeoxyribonuclease V alpha subunit
VRDSGPENRLPAAESEALLDHLFPPRPDATPDWQKLAVALALENRLTLISGGPGTGKTTTVAALLACLLATDPELRIALAAPTGKAAARLIEALGSRAGGLPAELQARLPREAHTVHRLLGVTPEPGRFRHHAGNPLAVDVLVVDEASMLDLALATRLVEAVPPGARLILLGDKDQLAAVEAGAVFAELSASPALGAACVARLAEISGIPAHAIVPPVEGSAAGPLADCVVWLTASHRFAADSGIGRLAALIREGDGAGAVDCLAGGDPALGWLDAAPAFAAMQAGYRPYLDALRAGAGPAGLFAAFDAFRVLCPLREGPRGVAAVNEALARWLRGSLAHPADPGPLSPWFPGRPVMVLRNDPALGLFNGDVGLCLAEASGEILVHFPDGTGGWRTLPPLRLPEHETALAMTVHKAQGSEFGEVLVLLPEQPVRVMSRELLYTAVTRARERVTLAGPGAVIEAACVTPTRRYSGLQDRLAEAQCGRGLPPGFPHPNPSPGGRGTEGEGPSVIEAAPRRIPE